MGDHEIKGLKEMFKTFDKDNSGTITMQEMADGLRKLQKDGGIAEAEVKRIMDATDVDGDGTLSYDEFIAATIHQNKLESSANLFKAFNTFDTDSSGSISKEELLTALKKYNMATDGVEELISECDANGDGQI